MHSVTYKGKRIYYVDSKDLHNPKIVLSSSSKVAKLSSLAFTIDKTKYREVARVNASIFEMATGTHQGWEFSDVFKTSCKNDTRADVIRFKDGTYLYTSI